MARRYSTANAFKAAMEARLRKLSAERRIDLPKLQARFAMERLVARLFHGANPPWLLKGGFAMDLRFRPTSRVTNDVDLSVPGFQLAAGTTLTSAMQQLLSDAMEMDLGDHMTFSVGGEGRLLAKVPGGGVRFLCVATLADKVYARFHLDIGCGDPLVGEPERLTGDDLLSFAGLDSVVALSIPRSLQFAEKVHAYTFPWEGRPNTRTKDLVDMVLLIQRGEMDPAEVYVALQAAFSTRDSHTLPPSLLPPPSEWREDFATMSAEADLPTTDYLEAYAIVAAYYLSLAPGPPP